MTACPQICKYTQKPKGGRANGQQVIRRLSPVLVYPDDNGGKKKIKCRLHGLARFLDSTNGAVCAGDRFCYT